MHRGLAAAKRTLCRRIGVAYRILGAEVDWASLDEALARFLKVHPDTTVA
jgi:hypothetical protein